MKAASKMNGGIDDALRQRYEHGVINGFRFGLLLGVLCGGFATWMTINAI